MTDDPAPAAARAAALKEAFAEKGLLPNGFVEDFTRHAEETWISRNGARMVARAWTDAAFRIRLLTDATAAAGEMGFELPKHHRHLVALENTPGIHNVIVCTQCSCTAFTIIGAAPDWYKDLDYRARVVRQARSVLAEMGLALPTAAEIRVWDTSADTRYMVLPLQPARTKGWDAEALAAIVTQDAMIGVAEIG
jgi:nitrile hydratase